MEFDQNQTEILDQAGGEVIELGNRLADRDPEADLWDIASGMLAGAVQFWLYSRQPCEDPNCESCVEVNTAARRLAALKQEIEELAKESEYYHSPNDADVGTA